MKFEDRYADYREAANAAGSLVRVCRWGGSGGQYVWVLNLETDEYIHCEGCADRTPFYAPAGRLIQCLSAPDRCTRTGRRADAEARQPSLARTERDV